MIAIFAALNEEIKAVRDKMAVDEQVFLKTCLILRGLYNKRPLLLIKSGIGKKAMRRAVNYCLSNFHLEYCINVGYAGGTTPFTNAGDFIIGSPVIDGTTKKSFLPEDHLLKISQGACKQAGLKTLTGGLAAMDRVIETSHEKAFVGTENDAIAIDMESSAFMEGCLSFSKPCLAVRSILDPLDTYLPNMGGVIRENGDSSPGNLFKYLIHKPKDAFTLLRIKSCASKAQESIFSFVEAWMNQ